MNQDQQSKPLSAVEIATKTFKDYMCSIDATVLGATTIAMEQFAAQQVAIAVAEKAAIIAARDKEIEELKATSRVLQDQCEDLHKAVEIQKNQLLFYAVTVLPEKDEEYERLKSQRSKCSCCNCPDCSGSSIIG